MGTRSHRTERCQRCILHLTDCICAEIPELSLHTRVVLVMHHKERYRTTNTGGLALEALSNHRWLMHGLRDDPADLRPLVEEGRRELLLFPSDDARVLTPELVAEDPRPVTLVVPDGNWRQASKAARRIPGADQFANVVLPEGPPTRYQLRHEPVAGGLATFEAIARAIGILESPEAQLRLETLFDEWVRRTLATRGNPAWTPAS